MNNKLLIIAVIAFLITTLVFAFCISSYVNGSTITSTVSVTNNNITVSGQKSDGGAVTVKLMLGAQIYYIDQKTAANNSFSFIFKIPERYVYTTYNLTLGGTVVSSPIVQEIIVPATNRKAKVVDVENNSIRVGGDVYSLDSDQLTNENIKKSVLNGKNQLFYKLGDKWYNLNDPAAISPDFLVSSNALTQSEVNSWRLDIWYPAAKGSAIQFEK